VSISPHEVRKNFFAFIFQLTGWALMATRNLGHQENFCTLYVDLPRFPLIKLGIIRKLGNWKLGASML